GYHRHSKRTGTRNHLLTDLAGSDQSEPTSKQPASFRKFFLVPLTAPQGDNVVCNAAIECEDQGKSEFGNGDRIFAGTVRNIDPALRSGRNIDRVVARARACHQLHWSSLEHRFCYFRTSDNQYVRRFRSNRVDKSVVFQIGLIRNLAAERLQTIPAG